MCLRSESRPSYWNVYWSNSNSRFSLQVVVVFSAELTDFDEVPDNSNKRPTYTVSSDSMQERRDYNFSIGNTTLKWSEKFLTMAVHYSSNVILLSIEYFIDSKGETENIKLLSTQNNYSPLFGLKKLVIFFISSDKTDKKLCRSWKYKTPCWTKRRGGQGMAFDQGASRPQGTISTAKSTGAPQNAWRLKLKKIQRI